MSLNNVVLECIWRRPAEGERELAKAMWREYGAMDSEARIDERARHIVYLIRDASGRVGGVSTARPVRVQLLNNHFFYEFRCYIAPPFRRAGLDTHLVVETKAFLERAEGSGEKFKGLIMFIENEELKRHKTRAVWPASEMVFAGYTAQGHHIRVGYFKGARI